MDMKERLKQLRKTKKLSQQKVAKAIGITTSAYGNYEQGKRKPRLEILVKLSEFYGVSIDYLIYGKDLYSINTNLVVLMDDDELIFFEKLRKLNYHQKLKIEGMMDLYLQELE